MWIFTRFFEQSRALHCFWTLDFMLDPESWICWLLLQLHLIWQPICLHSMLNRWLARLALSGLCMTLLCFFCGYQDSWNILKTGFCWACCNLSQVLRSLDFFNISLWQYLLVWLLYLVWKIDVGKQFCIWAICYALNLFFLGCGHVRMFNIKL